MSSYLKATILFLFNLMLSPSKYIWYSFELSQKTIPTTFIIGLDKNGYPVNSFLISPRKHMLWYSLEAPRRGAYNEYPQHMFLWRNKKNIENICCGYSLEAPRRGADNEYPQHIFSWRNKKNINTFGLKKAP